MSEQDSELDLSPLENALRSLLPAPGGLTRDQLLFRAGQASAARRGWFRPGAAACLGVVAAGLAVAWVLRPTPKPVERTITVVIREPAPAPQLAESVPPKPAEEHPAAVVLPDDSWEDLAGYLKLRKQVVWLGVESLPPPPASRPEQPLTVKQLLN